MCLLLMDTVHFICVLVCVYMHMCVCAYRYAGTCVCMWRAEVNLRCHQSLFTLGFEIEFLLELRAHMFRRLIS